MDMLEHAMAAHNAGLCVVPPKGDGSKAPLSAWRKYQYERPSMQQLQDWYSDGTRTGIGAVLGKVSGNVEMLEFDDKATYELYRELAHAAGLGDLVERIEQGYSEATPNGVHWFYRCEEIQGNTKLAQRLKSDDERSHANDNVLTLIETRGEGGYAVLAPTHGSVHPSGTAYVFLNGGYKTIADITSVEHKQLFGLARSLDAMPRSEPGKTSPAATSKPEGDQERPGDYFNRTRTWSQVLEPHGWLPLFTHGVETYWTRPGRVRVTSATTNYAETDLLKVFSTSTAFDTERTYSKFGAYTVLEHKGSFADAARAIRSEMPKADTLPPLIKPGQNGSDLGRDPKGAQSPSSPAPLETLETLETPQLTRLRSRLLDTQGVLDLPPPEWLIEGVLVKNSLAVVWGESGAYKSFLAVDWALSIATATWWKRRKIDEPANVLYIAAEGASGLGKRIKSWSKHNNIFNLSRAHWLPGSVDLLDAAQTAALTQIVSETKPAFIVIDTLARSIPGADENSAQDMGRLVDVADRLRVTSGATVMLVHHSTKAGGEARGSGSLRAAIDTEIEVKRDGSHMTMFCRKQKDAPEFNGLSLHLVVVDDSCVLSYVSRGSETYDLINQPLETVRQLFRETFSETGVTGAELRNVIMEQMKTSRATALRKINELVAESFITNRGTNRYPYYEPGVNYHGESTSHTSHDESSRLMSLGPMSHHHPPSIEGDGETDRDATGDSKQVELW